MEVLVEVDVAFEVEVEGRRGLSVVAPEKFISSHAQLD